MEKFSVKKDSDVLCYDLSDENISRTSSMCVCIVTPGL